MRKDRLNVILAEIWARWVDEGSRSRSPSATLAAAQAIVDSTDAAGEPRAETRPAERRAG